MLVIGFAGPARSGKSYAAVTLARMLAKKHDLRSSVESFAKPISMGLVQMGVTKKSHPELHRTAAQGVGTDIFRNHDPNWWVRIMDRRLSFEPLSGYPVVFIDDVRFPNEQRLVQSKGVQFVIDPGDRIDLTAPMYQHGSERMAMEWIQSDPPGEVVRLDNSGTMEQFDHVLGTLADALAQCIHAKGMTGTDLVSRLNGPLAQT